VPEPEWRAGLGRARATGRALARAARSAPSSQTTRRPLRARPAVATCWTRRSCRSRDGAGSAAEGQRERDRATRCAGTGGAGALRQRPSSGETPVLSERLARADQPAPPTLRWPLGQRPTRAEQERGPALLAGSKPRRSRGAARWQGAGGASGREPCPSGTGLHRRRTGRARGRSRTREQPPETGLRNGRRSE
jgi:hypothetical protein